MRESNNILSIRYDGFIDSYEFLDYEKGGSVNTKYLPWTQETARIVGYILLNEHWLKNHKIRRQEIQLKFQKADIPPGLEIEIEKKGEYQIIVPGHTMRFEATNALEIPFLINVRQVDNHFKAKHPTPVSFTLEVSGQGMGRFGRRIRIPMVKNKYDFYVGPDLGRTWVSFDPGTTASCLATGSETTIDNFNITIETEGKTEKITPSVLAFDLDFETAEPDWQQTTLDEYCYYGSRAERGIETENVKSFQSIKKLLGFIDQQEVQYKNGVTQHFDGMDLTHLLVQGLYRDLHRYIDQRKSDTRFQDLLDTEGAYNPKRAIVAIPNNFTLPKVYDMLQSIRRLNQFEEVRFISEAEAVLCYYIYSHENYSEKEEGLQDETVLIFDMGGATINTTISDVYVAPPQNTGAYYNIEIDSKIGYGIGGDTIDYCIAKYFFSKDFLRKFPVLAKLNPFDYQVGENPNKRWVLRQLILQIKMLLIEGVKTKKQLRFPATNPTEEGSAMAKKQVLVFPQDLSALFNNAIETIWNLESTSGVPPRMELLKDDKLYDDFIAKGNGKFPFFDFSLLHELVYKPVEDALTDVLLLSEGEGILVDTVLMSGRSVQFPGIEEIVTRVVNKVKKDQNSSKRKIIRLKGDALKTAVSKGACWYAINKDAVKLSPTKVTSNFGLKRTLNGNAKNIEFLNLIPAGSEFREHINGVWKTKGSAPLEGSFSFDANQIVFYQVMGKNPKEIIVKNEKHKFSRIYKAQVNLRPKRVGMHVYANDKVDCVIQTVTGDTKVDSVKLKEQEVKIENEEHYTWML